MSIEKGTNMKILLTAFEPFNGRDINPSQMILERIKAPENIDLIKRVLPVEFDATTRLLEELVEKERPDIILSLGQAGNAPNIAVERVAVNMDNCRSSNGSKELPDSSGAVYVDRPIIENAPDAYFATLPIWELVKAVNDEGVLCSASYSAGTYVCNHVMYVCCHLATKYRNMRTGFVHVPFLPEQMTENTQGYSMEFDDMLKGAQTIINYLAGERHD